MKTQTLPNKADALEAVRYSEIFYSIQGEGEYTGVPTGWLRFFMCNLQCNGFGQKDPTDPSTYELPYKDFDVDSVKRVEDLPVWHTGCDSSYSWSKKYKHLTHVSTPQEACDLVQKAMTTETNPEGTFLHPHSHIEQHMCFTGGEPLLPHAQRAVIAMMKEWRNRDGGLFADGSRKGSNQPEFITFETNGTRPLHEDFIDYFNNPGLFAGELFFSVSPKLWTVAGERHAIAPEIVREYHWLSKGRGQLKFVLGTDERQWDELERTVDMFRAAEVTYPVWIMPVGADAEMQEETSGIVAEKAFKRGYSVSARVHVDLWGNVIGV